MAPSDSLVIEVPSITRTRSSSADSAVVAKMAKDYKDGAWVTNGKTYKTYKDAGNDSQVYRRAFAKAKGVEVHKVVTRIWGINGDTVVTDKDGKADWKFALTINAERVKRTRNRAA